MLNKTTPKKKKKKCHPCNEQRYGDSDLNVCVVIIKVSFSCSILVY